MPSKRRLNNSILGDKGSSSWGLPMRYLGRKRAGRVVSGVQQPSAKCKSGTTVLLVQHPAPWSPWSPWSTLIHLGPHFLECGYTKWTKQDHGGSGVVPGQGRDHDAGCWIRSLQDHHGLLKNNFLMACVVS